MAAEKKDLIVISAEPISRNKVMDFIMHPSAGGISIFIGKQEYGYSIY